MLEHTDGSLSDALSAALFQTLGSLANHVGLQQGTLKKHMVVGEGLHHSSLNGLGHQSGALDVVRSVHDDFRLDDGHQTLALADASVTGERGSVLLNSQLRGSSTLGNVDDGAPLREASTGFVVGFRALCETSDTLCDGFIVRAVQGLSTFVNLNSGDNTFCFEEVHHFLSGHIGVAEEGFFEADTSRNVLTEALGGEQKGAVCLAVGKSVFDVNGSKTLSDGASTLIRSKNAFAGDSKGASRLHELGGEVTGGHL